MTFCRRCVASKSSCGDEARNIANRAPRLSRAALHDGMAPSETGYCTNCASEELGLARNRLLILAASRCVIVLEEGSTVEAAGAVRRRGGMCEAC
eukprot:scaffold31397_cov31-Tisochrysis_lutea.AAC.2